MGAPVWGRASVSWGIGVTTPVATTGGATGTTTVVLPVVTITALGFGGAESDEPDRVAEVVNSRIESTPALIVISVKERAEVIVTIYDAPALRLLAVIIVALLVVRVEPVIVAILILSFVAWSTIRTRTESYRIGWLNVRTIVLISDAPTVSRSNGLGVIDTAGEIGKVSVVPESANTAELTILMKIAIVATSEIRDIEWKMKK